MEDIIRKDRDLQTILICAVRYSLGRATYMPGLVTGWIKDNCEGKLSIKTLTVMASDINDARMRNQLGMECDALTWLRFYEWIENEVKRFE